ncbi:MAG: fibronectin type III domain-containing protein [Bacteroidales bacterium]|nr:fibronectin type III domain-containing protein [Bacteroidales bacterium]
MKKLYLFLVLLLATTMGVFAQSACSYTFSLHDGYGDGWNGAAINVMQGNTIVSTVDFTASASDHTVTVTLNAGVTYDLVWEEGNFDDECSFEITFNGMSLFTCEDASQLPAGSFLSIVGCSTCYPPIPYVAAMTITDVDLAWNSGGNTQWEYTYGAVGFNPNGASATISTVTDTFVNITGLTPATNYDFYIRTMCDPTTNQVSDWSKFIISMPQAIVGDIPYSTGFENDDDGSNWTLVNGNNTNKWYIGAAAHSTGSRALYISSNNGNSYNYNGYDESSVWAYRDIDLGSGGIDHMLTFDWKCEGYGYHYFTNYDYDYMEVYIGLPSGITDDVPAGATYLGRYMDNTSWQQANVLLSSQYSGIQRLYFRWINTDYSYSTSYLPAAVDNISITEMNCGSIDSVGVSALTTNSVTITPYTASSATDFVLYYKETTAANYDSVLVSTTPYILTNLSSGTNYELYMKVDCGNDDYGFPSNVITFRTLCDIITSSDLPYTEGFESYYLTDETFPTCWHQSSTYYSYYYSYPVISDGYYFAGDYSLYFNTETGSYNLGVLPELDANLDVSTLTLSFMMKGYDSYYGASHNAVIGVLTSATDLTTFVPVDTVSTTTNWSSIDVSFSNYTGSGRFIGILNQVIDSINDENNFYIDEVTLYVASDCKRPVNVTTSSILSDSVTLTWTPQGTETSWNVVVVEAGGNPDTATNVLTSNTTSITVGGLIGNTDYEAYIQADCGSETSIWTAPCSFLTRCSIYSVPFLEDFDAELMPPSQCWELAQGRLDTLSMLSSATYGWSTSSIELGAGLGSHVYNNIFGDSRKHWLISPSIDLGDGSTPCQLDLDVKLTSYYTGNSTQLNGTDDIFAVVVSTDNGNTWRKANAFIWDNDSTSNSYGVYNDLADVLTHFEIPLMDQNGTPYSGVVRIALYGESTMSNADNNLRVDNFAVNPLSNCPRPTHLVFSNVDIDHFTASWTSGGTETAWNIVVVPADADVSTGVPVAVTDTFHTFTGLDANTAYKVYVQSDCGLDSYSGYLTGVVKTACDAIDSLPFFEGFEDYSTGNGVFPDCWTNLSPAGVNVYVYDYPVPTGVRALYFYTSSNSEGLVAMPQFDPVAYPLNTLQVNFSMITDYPTDKMIVGYVTDLMDASTFVGLDTVSCAGANAESFEVPLNQCTAPNAWIAFKAAFSTTAYSSYLLLDDVQVEPIPDCPRPTNLHVVSSASNTIDLAWTPTGAENEWEIVYDVTGFNPDNATPISVYTTPSTTITNLSDSITYDFYVRAVCGVGENSLWRGPITAMPNTYCMNTSGTATVTMCGGHIYDNGGPDNDYSDDCNSTLVVMPDAPGMVVQLQGTYAVESGYDYLRIYDGADVSGTLLFESTSQSGVVPLVESTTGPLTIYFESDVMISYDGFDLAVSCVPAPTCIKPNQFVVNGTTNSDVTLSWTENGSATSWDIEYGAHGFTLGQGTMVSVTTNPYTINNLTAGTAYDFYVRANCGGGDESDWTGPITAIPGAFVMPTLGEHTVSMCGGVIYDDGGANGNYSSDCDVTVVVNPDTAGLMVRLTGTFNVEEDYDLLTIYDGVGTTGTVLFDSDIDAALDVVSTTGSLTIRFESDGSVTYSGFELQVSCEGGTTPPEPCNAPANVAVSNVTTNAATVDWTQEGTPDSWVINYKKSSVDTWTTINTSTHPYTITNLEAETSYSVFVIAVCGEEESTPSNTASFTTEPDGVNVYANSTIVYPNPTTGKFRIENSELRIGNVEVYDVYGKLMQAVEVNGNVVDLDASAYAAGMYFVRIACEKGIVTKPFIKK